ncbi:hypothetical protein AJ85_18385 [Alkalihalobacillus alcalophilus ATCC 27647 = CGMCC 1.3604]|uniref:Uncharacterized protein n=1 Tax=Alkalihalobacillus alcalophilus ATCC 27647 = CGMCC 1.3604 TaxID=1218173 RepID=A0A4S4JVY2_ALKAL|nr:hypothetical protein AJ85_18385 [Alkalihalobacillus alcalophilus ATCC 27647 = CGMCC 1.3604]
MQSYYHKLKVVVKSIEREKIICCIEKEPFNWGVKELIE